MSVLLNRKAPDFSLPALVGGRFSLADWRGSVVVINFWSSECLWSRRADVFLVYRLLTWQSKGVRIVGIMSNVNETQNQITLEAEKRRVQYPILQDIDFKTADLYKAETTPHTFVVDKQGLIRYVGALDDATAEQLDPHKHYLDQAVTALLAGRLPEPALTTPYGCPIVRQMPTLNSPSVHLVPMSGKPVVSH